MASLHSVGGMSNLSCGLLGRSKLAISLNWGFPNQGNTIFKRVKKHHKPINELP